MPKTNYNQVSFWEQKYKVSLCEHYEWLCRPQEVFNSISKYLDYSNMAKVLQIGCGTSTFALKLKRQVQARQAQADITCVDFSKQLIKKCRTTKATPGLAYISADIRNLSSLPSQSFDYIFDKGCFDCLFCNDNFTRQVLKGLRECYKLLKDNGKLIIISHGKPKIRIHLFRNKLVPFNLKYQKITTQNKNDPACYAYICTKNGQNNQQNNDASGEVLPQHQNSDQQKQNQQKNDQPKLIIQQLNQKKKKSKQNEESEAPFILPDSTEGNKKQKNIKNKKNGANQVQQAPFILPEQKRIVGDFILQQENLQQQQQGQKNTKQNQNKQQNSQANFILNQAQYENQFDYDEQ